MTVLNLNLSDYEIQEGFTPVPAGDYEVQVENSEVKTTKTNNTMLKITLTIISGAYTGRKIFENFVLSNSIAMSRLKTLASVGGHPRPDCLTDSEELHGIKCIVSVTIKTDDEYGPSNRVKSFKRIKNETSPVLSAPAPVPTITFAQAPANNPSFASAPTFVPTFAPAPAPAFVPNHAPQTAQPPADDDLPF